MSGLSPEWWTRVLTDGRGELSLTARGELEHYLLLPNANDPRVVVDSSSPTAIGEAVTRFAATRSLPFSVGDRLARIAAAAASRRKGWVVSGGAGRTLKVALSELLGTRVELSIAVGPPRPNRKPVVRCWNGAELVAIAKLGPEDHTAAMVRNEAVWLERMQADPIEGVVTPKLIHAGEWGRSALLVMSALPLAKDQAVPIEDLPGFVVEGLANRTGIGERSVDAVWWPSLRSRLSGSDDDVVLKTIDEVAGDSRLSSVAGGAWHGDWSPWNVGRLRDGRWAVWDWERAGDEAPIGFDLLHLHHQYGSGISAADDAIADLGVPDDHVLLLRRMYLLELVARHLEAGATDTDRHATVRELLIADVSDSAAAERHKTS